ncbi:MAG TPA: hypothetical protein VH372_01685, partial [Actinospica sp.]|nr:hypothetical protein [Actinospica sp.]
MSSSVREAATSRPRQWASGTTPVSLHFASGAKELGSRVLAVTADPTSPLGTLADVVLPVPPPAAHQPIRRQPLRA